MHPCVKLQVLLCALGIILVAALTVVLCLETREVILQQVSPGERTANARTRHSFKWEQILG